MGEGQAELNLVRHERLPHGLAQQRHDLGRLIGDAEVADLARGFQGVEGPRDLVGLHQHIGAVEQQNVEVIGAEAGQAAVDGGQEVVVGEIVPARADAALRLHDHFVALDSVVPDGAEDGLALAASVDVGVIEEVDPAVDSGVKPLPRLGRLARHPHATVDDDRHVQLGERQPDHLHRATSAALRFTAPRPAPAPRAAG